MPRARNKPDFSSAVASLVVAVVAAVLLDASIVCCSCCCWLSASCWANWWSSRVRRLSANCSEMMSCRQTGSTLAMVAHGDDMIRFGLGERLCVCVNVYKYVGSKYGFCTVRVYRCIVKYRKTYNRLLSLSFSLLD